jgi:hypothetical protein
MKDQKSNRCKASGVRINAQLAESLRTDFGFPDCCDMAVLLAWPQSFLSSARSGEHLTPAGMRDTFASLRDHVVAVQKLMAVTDVRTALMNPFGDMDMLFNAERTKDCLGMVNLYEDILSCLEHFAAGQEELYAQLTTRGRQPQPRSAVRLVCAKTLLNIWQHYRGDPRGNRQAIGSFYQFMQRAFSIIGDELTDDETRVVLRKLRQVWDNPKSKQLAARKSSN